MHHPLGIHAVFIKSFCSHRGEESLPRSGARVRKLMLCGRKPREFWGESMQNSIHTALGWVWLSWFPCARLGLGLMYPHPRCPQSRAGSGDNHPCEEMGLPHSPVLCGTPWPHRATAALHSNRDKLPTRALLPSSPSAGPVPQPFLPQLPPLPPQLQVGIITTPPR